MVFPETIGQLIQVFLLPLKFLIISEVQLNKVGKLKRQINNVRHFLVFLYQVLLKRAYLLMVQVLVVLVNLNHRRRALHKINCEILKVMKQQVVSVYSDRFSVLDQENVPGH